MTTRARAGWGTGCAGWACGAAEAAEARRRARERATNGGLRHLRNLLLQEHDDDGAPGREEDVPDGVGDGVAEDGELAVRLVLDRAERGRDGAGAGAGAERMTGFILRTYRPKRSAAVCGATATTKPTRRRLGPVSFRPATNVGPAFRPTTPMKTARPIVSKTQSAGSGILPNVGRTERSQPKTRPMMSAPPLAVRLSGRPPTVTVRRPTKPPRRMPRPTKTTSVSLDGRST